jgi:hypothetical protein
MPISVDARSQTPVNGTSIALSHTVAADANFLAVILCFGQSSTETGISGTFNGAAFSLVYSGGSYWKTYIYKLAAPSAGTYNINFSWTNSSLCSVHAISLKGVDIANAIRDSDGNDNLGTGPFTLTLDASGTDYVFSGFAAQNGYGTIASPLTTYGNVTPGANHFGTGADGAATGATVDVSWGNPEGVRCGTGAITIRAGVTGGNIAFTPNMML